MRFWIVIFLALALALGSAQGQPTAWIQSDNSRPEDAGDGPAPADLVDLYFSLTATHMVFREDLAALPDVGIYTYTVYVDFPRGGGPIPDFRLVHSESGSHTEQWDGTAWTFVEPINVTADPSNTSFIFEGSSASLGQSQHYDERVREASAASRISMAPSMCSTSMPRWVTVRTRVAPLVVTPRPRV